MSTRDPRPLQSALERHRRAARRVPENEKHDAERRSTAHVGAGARRVDPAPDDTFLTGLCLGLVVDGLWPWTVSPDADAVTDLDNVDTETLAEDIGDEGGDW